MHMTHIHTSTIFLCDNHKTELNQKKEKKKKEEDDFTPDISPTN